MECVILDDEPYAHQVLQHYIMQTPGLQVKASFRNSIEAFEYLRQQRVDLLFLDVEMPLIKGTDFLKALPSPPKTIFTTAYKQYAFDSYELEVVDYLLKPFSYERFLKAVAKTRQADGQELPESPTLFIRNRQGGFYISQADILYLEASRDYVRIVTTKGVHQLYHTLKGLLTKLDSASFMQIHRSYIVNKKQIARIQSGTLVLSDQTHIPIGESYRKKLIAYLSGS